VDALRARLKSTGTDAMFLSDASRYLDAIELDLSRARSNVE